VTDLRGWIEVAAAVFIVSSGAWIGCLASAPQIAILTVGCFVIDAIVYAVAITFDRPRYHIYMITAMMVTGGFLAPMWITGVITGIIGLF